MRLARIMPTIVGAAVFLGLAGSAQASDRQYRWNGHREVRRHENTHDRLDYRHDGYHARRHNRHHGLHDFVGNRGFLHDLGHVREYRKHRRVHRRLARNHYRSHRRAIRRHYGFQHWGD